MTQTLLTLGHGYTARALAARLRPLGWRLLGTVRDPGKADALTDAGVTPVPWEPAAVTEALQHCTHLLASAAPDADGDPALRLVGPQIVAHAPGLAWAGYLSTTSVYGNHDGAWVDETTQVAPGTARGQARVAAEQAWTSVARLPVHIFRLAGIYGPGRGPFSKVRNGTAQRIVKPGQVFSRIHVDDIAQVLHASMDRPDPGAIYNVCDDDPAPPQDVIGHAADLLGVPRPPDVDFDTATLSRMARSFYADNKRVRNDRIKTELGVALRYPDYRAGLAALLAAEDGS